MAKKSKGGGASAGGQVKPTKVTKDLPCKVSDLEKADKRTRIAALLTRYDAVEAKKKEVTSTFSTEMKQLRSEMSKLAREVDTGVEEKPVLCEERPVYPQNAMQTVRLDTNEIVSERALKSEELQTNMTIVAPSKRADDDDDGIIEDDDPQAHH